MPQPNIYISLGIPTSLIV